MMTTAWFCQQHSSSVQYYHKTAHRELALYGIIILVATLAYVGYRTRNTTANLLHSNLPRKFRQLTESSRETQSGASCPHKGKGH